ncbi:MAG: NAD-dependent epimerase/dehydratase family protein [Bryobacteraceae bacterium]
MKDLKWKEALPRAAADFLIVQASMVGALLISVAYRTELGHGAEARALIETFAHQYTVFFWLLAPIFPLTFLLNGFYTRTRGYAGRHKAWAVLRGVAMAVLLFFGANVLLFGGTSLGRSAVIPFMVLASVGLVSARLLKGLLELYFVVRPKSAPSVSNGPGRVLVVGGAGYIGSLLAERLLEKGYRVRVLDSLLYGDEPLRPVRNHPEFELIVGDCRNIQDVVRAVRGVEAIVHLAAIVGDPACEQDHEPALETNYAATRMLIEIAKGHGVSRFVFASSCSVYGATDAVMDENSAVQPVSLYGQTKVDSERALLAARSEVFHPTVLRYATVFGLGYRPRFDLVVNLLTAKAHQEGVITIYNGQQWRPFIHVRDLVEATVRVLEAPVRLVSGQIFNVGDTRQNHTLTEVSEIVRRVFPAVRIEHINNSDLRNYKVNFDKILNLTGFKARYTVEEGVAELKSAFDQGQITDYMDLRYHNQRYLKAVGSPGHKDEADAMVMAAFSNHRQTRQATAAASAPATTS